MDPEELEFAEALLSLGVNDCSHPSKTTRIVPEFEAEDDECEIEQFLEPFAKEKLIDFLKEAADKDSDFRDKMKRAADCSLLHRQIYVRSRVACSTETLVDYFKNFGEILDCKTSYFRDFRLYYGFILFKNRIGACKAVKIPMRCIGDIHVYCDFPRKDNFPERGKRRVSVSNIKEETDVDKLMELFSEFGEIEEGPLDFGNITRKIKGHCSFVYKTRESAMEAIKEPKKMLEGQGLYCHLDSDSHVLDPEHGNPPNPIISSLCRVPEGAKDYNAGPKRAHGDAGADQNPTFTEPGHQGLSTPSIPEPQNPPNPHLLPTNLSMVPQGAIGYNAVPEYITWPRSGTVHGYAGADQNPFFMYPYHQQLSTLPAYLYPYHQGSSTPPTSLYPDHQGSLALSNYADPYVYQYPQGSSSLSAYVYPSHTALDGSNQEQPGQARQQLMGLLGIANTIGRDIA